MNKFEDLTSGTVEAGLRKIAAVAVFRARMGKTADLMDTITQAGQTGLEGLKNLDPRYLAGAAALGAGGISALHEAAQPEHKRRWTNPLLNAGLAGALGAGVGLLPQMLGQMSGPEQSAGAVQSLARGAQSVARLPGLSAPARALGVNDRMPATALGAGVAAGGAGLKKWHDWTGRNGQQLAQGWRASQGSGQNPIDLTKYDPVNSPELQRLSGDIEDTVARGAAPGAPSANDLRTQQNILQQVSQEQMQKQLDTSMSGLTSRTGPAGYFDRVRARQWGIPQSGQFTWRERLPLLNRLGRTTPVIGDAVGAAGTPAGSPRGLAAEIAGRAPRGPGATAGNIARGLGVAAVPALAGGIIDWLAQ